MARMATVFVVLALLSGCAPPPTPAGMTVGATGTISGCSMSPHWGLASFTVAPDRWTAPPGWQPEPDDARFEVELAPGGWAFTASGLAVGGPATLAPGRYTFAIATSQVSDLCSAPFTFETPICPLVGTEVRCMRAVEIPTGTAEVIVTADFNEPCRIDVTIVPGA